MGLAVQRKIGEGFADHWREFEPVAGKTDGEGNVLALGMGVDNEMPVGADLIEAALLL